jgi:hypothetical protein
MAFTLTIDSIAPGFDLPVTVGRCDRPTDFDDAPDAAGGPWCDVKRSISCVP